MKYRFNISASQINMFIECPSAWALKYHYGYKSAVSEKMLRGTHFEDKVNHHLVDYEGYNEVTYDLSEAELEAARKTALIIQKVFLNDAICQQKKLSSGNKVGYLDYSNDKHILDLKTTSKTPSKIPIPNLRQMAFYRDFYRHLPDELTPKITLLYVVILTTQIKYVMFTNSPWTFHQFRNCVGELTHLYHFDDEELDRAQLENDRAVECITTLYENPSYVKALPVNVNHFYVKGFDEDVKEGYLNGELAPCQ